jgi:hypothetical protein
MKRLRAGPVTMFRGTAVIPVTQVVVGALGPAVCGSVTPVAVVIVTDGESVTWTMDGHVEPTKRWLDAVPELRRLIVDATEFGGP